MKEIISSQGKNTDTKFQKFIKTYGIGNLAADIRIERGTVRFWYTLKCVPRPHHMKILVALSRNTINYEDIISSYVDKTDPHKAKKSKALK